MTRKPKRVKVGEAWAIRCENAWLSFDDGWQTRTQRSLWYPRGDARACLDEIREYDPKARIVKITFWRMPR